ncbi:MAG: carboxypeptidase regulatory-like domain-containing protein [Candidatus Moraniibacteriota bacterium]|nr:MAG: carboxypeptidase regulatory-like domain-containing protein [Candidatus Moranbacteria bacterium]
MNKDQAVLFFGGIVFLILTTVFGIALTGANRELITKRASERAEQERRYQEDMENNSKLKAVQQAAGNIRNQQGSIEQLHPGPLTSGSVVATKEANPGSVSPDPYNRVPARTGRKSALIFGDLGLSVSAHPLTESQLRYLTSPKESAGSLQVFVIDGGGGFVSGALCRLFTTAGYPAEGYLLSRLSDKNGICLFRDILAGEYSVETFTKNGMEHTVSVSVSPNRQTAVFPDIYPIDLSASCSDTDGADLFLRGSEFEVCRDTSHVMESGCGAFLPSGPQSSWSKIYFCPNGCSEGACKN